MKRTLIGKDDSSRCHWFRRVSALSAGIIAATLFLGSKPAHAAGEMSSLRGTPRFDLHVDVGWRQAYGVGGRVEFPIVPEGLLQRADDDLTLSLGAEVFFPDNRYGAAVWPLAALQWNFYLSDRWSIFPELGVVAFAGDKHHNAFVHTGPVIAPFVGFGARFHLSPRAALLARVNWPAGLQFGVAF